MKGWTSQDVERLGAKASATPPKKLKYGNVRTSVDGITFDSKKEARRYLALKMLAAAGEITDLKLQPSFPLLAWSPDGPVSVGTYRGDFSYVTKDGEYVLEDVKGGKATKTQMYRLKAKMVKATHGITITVT